MQSMCTITIVVLNVQTGAREPSRVPEKMLKRLSLKNKIITELCTELFEEKRTKVSESSSLDQKYCNTAEKFTQDSCEICTKNEKETNF